MSRSNDTLYTDTAVYGFRIGGNVWRIGAPEWGMGTITDRKRVGLMNVYLIRFGDMVRWCPEDTICPD